MRAHVELSTVGLAYDVWLIRDLPGGAIQTAELGGNQADDQVTMTWLSWRDVEPANRDRNQPTMTLPREAFEAIMAAGGNVLPPDRAMAAHLADAVSVRDRLLTMLETAP